MVSVSGVESNRKNAGGDTWEYFEVLSFELARSSERAQWVAVPLGVRLWNVGQEVGIFVFEVLFRSEPCVVAPKFELERLAYSGPWRSGPKCEPPGRSQ